MIELGEEVRKFGAHVEKSCEEERIAETKAVAPPRRVFDAATKLRHGGKEDCRGRANILSRRKALWGKCLAALRGSRAPSFAFPGAVLIWPAVPLVIGRGGRVARGRDDPRSKVLRLARRESRRRDGLLGDQRSRTGGISYLSGRSTGYSVEKKHVLLLYGVVGMVFVRKGRKNGVSKKCTHSLRGSPQATEPRLRRPRRRVGRRPL